MDDFSQFFPDDNEPNAVSVDLDGDGILDAVGYTMDADGDGVDDTLSFSQDTDGDGVDDMIVLTSDLDGDGEPDTVSLLSDLDGDGEPDEMTIINDLDGDGKAEIVTLTPDGAYIESGESDAALQGMADMMDEDDMGIRAANYDPDQDDEDVLGTPAHDMQYWQCQGDSGPCAVYSQTFAFNSLTGKNISPESMVDLARAEGIYTEDGTTMEDMGKLLQVAGLDADMRYGSSVQDLTDCWSQGGKTIVTLDSDEIWYGERDTFLMPQSPDHAVEVIGIQGADTDSPMVILNDPGTPDGCGLCVPMDVFMDAWEDSGYQLVTAYLP